MKSNDYSSMPMPTALLLGGCIIALSLSTAVLGSQVPPFFTADGGDVAETVRWGIFTAVFAAAGLQVRRLHLRRGQSR